MSEIEIEKLEGIKECGGSVKRFYAPFVIKWKCSKCGTKNEWSLKSDYLSYPPYFEPFQQILYCSNEDCWNEDEVTLQLDFTLSTRL